MTWGEILAKLRATRPGSPNCRGLYDVARDVQNIHEITTEIATTGQASTTLFIYGLATGAVADSDPTFTIDTITSLTSGCSSAFTAGRSRRAKSSTIRAPEKFSHRQ